MSKKSLSNILTEVELEIMNILWSLGEGTVRDVLAELPTNRNLAYTSASTMIRILEQKNIVKSKKDGKTHIYKPVLSKKKYEEKTLTHVVKNVFQGEASSLVKRLVSDTKLTESEKQQIKEILSELK